jgi:hypothetical protein
MAKIRMQWKAPKESLKNLTEEEKHSLKYKSAWDILRKVYVAEGFKGWYSGLGAQISKAVFCQAIIFTLKEKVRDSSLW